MQLCLSFPSVESGSGGALLLPTAPYFPLSLSPLTVLVYLVVKTEADKRKAAWSRAWWGGLDPRGVGSFVQFPQLLCLVRQVENRRPDIEESARRKAIRYSSEMVHT